MSLNPQQYLATVRKDSTMNAVATFRHQLCRIQKYILSAVCTTDFSAKEFSTQSSECASRESDSYCILENTSSSASNALPHKSGGSLSGDDDTITTVSLTSSQSLDEMQDASLSYSETISHASTTHNSTGCHNNSGPGQDMSNADDSHPLETRYRGACLPFSALRVGFLYWELCVKYQSLFRLHGQSHSFTTEYVF